MHNDMKELFYICFNTHSIKLITKFGSILTKQCLGSGDKTRVGRGTGNTQLIYLGLIYETAQVCRLKLVGGVINVYIVQ